MATLQTNEDRLYGRLCAAHNIILQLDYNDIVRYSPELCGQFVLDCGPTFDNALGRFLEKLEYHGLCFSKYLFIYNRLLRMVSKPSLFIKNNLSNLTIPMYDNLLELDHQTPSGTYPDGIGSGYFEKRNRGYTNRTPRQQMEWYKDVDRSFSCYLNFDTRQVLKHHVEEGVF